MNISVTYYNQNLHKTIDLPDTTSEELTVKVKQMVNGIDDMYKNIVSEEDITNVKQSRECIEIIFPDTISASFSWNKEINFRKILIVFPIEGQDTVLAYLGDKIYFSPLYISSNGAKTAYEIKSLIDLNLK